MPTPTYTPLANITLGSSAASVTFSSINQGFRDLVLVVNGYQTGGNGVWLRMNGDTGSNYAIVQMWGTGSGTGSAADSGGYSWMPLTYATNWSPDSTKRGTYTASIMDYSATDKHKTVLGRGSNTWTSGVVEAGAGRWFSTSAITSLTVGAWSDTWASGTTMALYGIAS